MDRALDWDGCLNARDLGGLPIDTGGATAFGAIIRSDNPAFLSSAGWASARAYGVRTIVGLRTAGAHDAEPDPSLVSADVDIVSVEIEDATDPDFVGRWADSGLWGTPIYFRDALERWPERHAAAAAAVANAKPGGVVVACGRGCDRTGIMSMLFLALAGVAADDIADDWELSVACLRPRDPTYEGLLAEALACEDTTIREAFRANLAGFDVVDYLRSGGLEAHELDALLRRLIA